MGGLWTAWRPRGFETFTFAGNGRNPGALWRIRRYLRGLRPDVLHCNDPHALTGVGLAAVGLGIPARIAARRTSFPIRSPLPYRWLCDRVACVSREAARLCRDGGIPDAMLRVVHDGVDPDRVGGGDRRRRAMLPGSQQRPTAVGDDCQVDRLQGTSLSAGGPAGRNRKASRPDRGVRRRRRAARAVGTAGPAAGGRTTRPFSRLSARRAGPDPSGRPLRSSVAPGRALLDDHRGDACRANDCDDRGGRYSRFGWRRTAALTPCPSPRGRGEAWAGGMDRATVQFRRVGGSNLACLGIAANMCHDAGARRRRAEELFAAECMVEATLAVYREVLAASGIAHSRGRLCNPSDTAGGGCATAVAGPR